MVGVAWEPTWLLSMVFKVLGHEVVPQIWALQMNTIEDLAAITFGSIVVMGFFAISIAFFINSFVFCAMAFKDAWALLF